MPTIDESRAVELVMELIGLRGPSCEEEAVAHYIEAFLASQGIDRQAIHYDQAHKKTPRPGRIGNLIVKLPGSAKKPRIMLSAHMDTVPICVGAQPQRKGKSIRPAIRTTGLGGDDRAGVAAILVGLMEARQTGLPLPPVTLCFFIQEEIGLQGSRHLQTSKLGKVDMAFNFDGSSPTRLTIGATGGEKLRIVLHGLAAHAGLAPQEGASALHAAGLAIADLHRHGWLGAIKKGKRLGTSNIGVIQGGSATNVVCDRVEIEAEARSHDNAFRATIASAIEEAFVRAAAQVKSSLGPAVTAEVHRRTDYESFKLGEQEPVVLRPVNVVQQVAGPATVSVSNGGLDANWLVRHGIPTVTLGCGQREIHTTSEWLDIPDYLSACRIARELILAP